MSSPGWPLCEQSDGPIDVGVPAARSVDSQLHVRPVVRRGGPTTNSALREPITLTAGCIRRGHRHESGLTRSGCLVLLGLRATPDDRGLTERDYSARYDTADYEPQH